MHEHVRAHTQTHHMCTHICMHRSACASIHTGLSQFLLLGVLPLPPPPGYPFPSPFPPPRIFPSLSPSSLFFLHLGAVVGLHASEIAFLCCPCWPRTHIPPASAPPRVLASPVPLHPASDQGSFCSCHHGAIPGWHSEPQCASFTA